MSPSPVAPRGSALRRGPRTAVAAVVAAAVVAALAACTGSGADGAVQRRDSGGSDTGFVGGSGVVTVVEPAARTAPADFVAPLLGGSGELDLAALRGDVVVLNVWGSWCAPCRAEADDLEAAWQQLEGRDVRFVGVNTRDTDVQAREFVAEYDVTYPSVVDETGEQLLAFRASLPPNAIPTTLVLDRAGRVAARVNGEVTAATVVGMVEDVLAERA